MTFYEAALRVLESAGRPLHVQEITEQSIAQNMLSHVGKAPDKTMLSRLAAMARRTRDRRVIVTAKDTFALAEWAIPEDPEALAQTGIPESNPEELLPTLRPAERHPDARPENVRASGRPADRHRRHDEEELRGRRRRYSPVAELVLSLLSNAAKPLKPAEIAELIRERDLGGTEPNGEQILTSLLEENQRRIDSGRRPQFILSKESGEVSLEQAGSEAAPSEVQAVFAAALGVPIEGGRPLLPRASSAVPVEPLEAVNGAVRAAAKDARRSVARELRRKLIELDVEAFHKAFVKVLQALGFRELKVAKRSRDGLLLTARKREGSVDLRFAVRLLRGTGAIDRRAVQELRRDLGHYSAQVGLIASAGEVRGDGRAEAQSYGALTMVWSADALAEKFIEAGSGVTATHVDLFEIDERFFVSSRLEAEQARRRRDERIRERQARDDRKSPDEAERQQSPAQEIAEGTAASELVADQTHAEPDALERAEPSAGELSDNLEDESAEGEAEQPKTPEVEETAPVLPSAADRKRRRRRRRGRRGRARPPEPPAPASGQGAAPATPADGGPEPAATPQSENETS